MTSPTAAPNPPRIVEYCGWYGTVAIVLAYALSSFEVLTTKSAVYQALNLTGALGVAWICFHRRTWQAFWLEAVWAAIAAIALARSVLT